MCIEGASINVKEAQTLMENEDELDMDALNKSQKELVAYLEAMKMLDEKLVKSSKNEVASKKKKQVNTAGDYKKGLSKEE